MKKNRTLKPLENNQEYYRPETYVILKQDFEKHLDDEITEQRNKMRGLVKRLKDNGYTDEFICNLVLSKIYARSGLIS